VQMRNPEALEVRFALIEDVRQSLIDAREDARLRSPELKVDLSLSKLESENEADVEDLETLRKLSDATPIVTLVDSLLRSAVEDDASDIHIEPWPDKTLVRYRLDGVLHAVRTLPKQIQAAVVSRIKVMSHMDITVRHVPQDGRASMRYNRKDFDLRLSTVPTHHGEKVVIRLLEKNPSYTTLSAVGLNDKNYAMMAPLINRPHGMILCCGPTGSGKSTTLFAVLQEINDGTTNITTIEDPIEYSVNGVNQIEVSTKRGLTFSSVLRALLRQDPDVIYVGEIRDRETAEIALSAALTGHLLLTTLHTVNAVGAVNRLLDMGMEPFLVASALTAATAQRLVRAVCKSCSQPYTPTPEQLAELETRTRKAGVVIPAGLALKFRAGKGCASCRGTGYYGRVLLFEILVATPALREAILNKGSVDELRNVAGRGGLQPLLLDGLRKAGDGRTTLSEILRVVDATD